MIHTVIIDNKEYPKNLRNIYDPPQKLFVNGAFAESDDVAVALVGSRRASAYGIETAERLGFELAARGVAVVSGMALGIDSAAHRGALRAGGRTIAVMGSGHGHIYPPKNAGLYEEIARKGAVVTEYEDSEEPLTWHFPQRNRIISGLSLGVVVVEAARNSGALITANFAAEQGRTVFAVPGQVSSHTSSGTNELIKDGARLVQSADDIVEELSLVELKPVPAEDREKIDGKIQKMTNAYIYNSLTDDERKIYKTLSNKPLYIDDVIEKAGMAQQAAAKTLLALEMKKLVTQMAGKQYVRKG